MDSGEKGEVLPSTPDQNGKNMKALVDSHWQLKEEYRPQERSTACDFDDHTHENLMTVDLREQSKEVKEHLAGHLHSPGIQNPSQQ